MKKNISLFSFGLISLLLWKPVYAFDVKTHKAINKTIATGTFNSFSLDGYLKTNLGICEGVEATFKDMDSTSNKVYDWIKLGGEYEDVPYWYMPYLRSVNHFHNPLTDAGYSGFWGTGIMSGMSSTQWVLQPQSTQSPGGYYSWYDVRDNYLKVLTLSTKTDRDTYFAETFRGIGQLMHLVEDASVPAHTRDDGHLFYNYETWVRDKADVSSYTPTFFAGTINDIASFIDTNTYKSDGSNPQDTASNTVGLSEYTNANFFSEDTINASNFPYPDITQTTVIERTAPSGNYQRQYYLKNCCGETNGGQGYLLAAVDYLDYWREQDQEKYGGLSKIPILDDNVYSDNASLLLPCAVGYSAGLLNYFFRGELEVVQNSNSNSITITNNSSEDMDGAFTLYYDASDDIRKSVSDGSWSIVLEAGSSSNELNFTEPEDLGEDKRYILVFEGTLGSESNAVVGKIFQPCTEEFKLTASNATPSDGFGNSVSISGDIAIVGVPYDNDAGFDSGSAYVFVRNAERWEVQAKLIASDAAEFDFFGRSVAIDGDVVIIGSFGDDDAGARSGSAYVFIRNGDAWEEQAKLTASDAAAYDHFGAFVAISGDVIIVGSPGNDNSSEYSSGAAYIFVRNGNTWEEKKKLIASDASSYDEFGSSVAISGDVAIVGSQGNDNSSEYNSGAAYIFVRNGNTWEEKKKLIARDASSFNYFGVSVAISGNTAIVGSFWDNDAGERSGSAYIFVRNGNTWEEQAKLTASDAAQDDWFGNSVAISGDVAIVGSFKDDDAGERSGSAYVFVHNGDTWKEKKKLTASDASAHDEFGRSVAISGDVAIVGTPYDDDAGSNSGSAYIKYYNRCPQ